MTTNNDELRVKRLLVARESSTQDLPMLENMIAQTVGQHPEIAEAEFILQAGVRPLVDEHFPDRRLYPGVGFTAVLYRAGETWVLISKGSATKVNSRQENAFTEILCAVLQELRPEHLLLATFSRMIRSATLSGRLLAACTQYVDVVHCRESRLEMRTPAGEIMWQMLGMLSSTERDSQMTRLTLGRLALHRRGRWCWSASAVPLGWRLTEDRRVVLDPPAVSLVRHMLVLLGDSQVTLRSILAELSALGLQSPRRSGTGQYEISAGGTVGQESSGVSMSAGAAGRGDAAGAVLEDFDGLAVGGLSVEAMAAADGVDPAWDADPYLDDGLPRSMVKRAYRWLSVYETGVYETDYEVPVRLSSLAEYPVVAATQDAPAHVHVRYELPLPEGGFASAADFAAARAVRDERAQRWGAWDRAARRLPLLAGQSRTFDYDGRDLRLGSYPSSKSLYGLFLADTVNKSAVATCEAPQLHRAIAEASISCLRDGAVFGRLDVTDDLRSVLAGGTRRAPSLAERMRQLEGQRRALQGRLTRAVNASLDPKYDTVPALGDRYREEAATAQRELESLDRQMQELHASAEPATEVMREFDVDGELIAALLAGLANETEPVPQEVAAAVTDLIGDLRCRQIGPMFLEFGFTLRLPTSRGWVRSAELSATVRNRRRPEGSGVRHGAAEATELWMTTETTFPELGGALSRQVGQSLRVRVTDELARLGVPEGRKTLPTLHPLLVARRSLWARLTGQPDPDGVETAYVDLIERVYLQTAGTLRLWMVPHAQRHEAVLKALRDGEGRRPKPALLAQLIAQGMPETVLRTAVTHPPVLLQLPSGPGCGARAKVGSCGRDDCSSHGKVAAIPCPHCGGWADRLVNVPENPTGLLCYECMRSPDQNSLRYPDEYRQVGHSWYEQWITEHVPDVAGQRLEASGGTVDMQYRRKAATVGIEVPTAGSISRLLRARIDRALDGEADMHTTSTT